DHHDHRPLPHQRLRDDVHRRIALFAQGGGAAQQRGDIEDDHHGTVAEDGGAEDAGNARKLRADRLDHDFAATQQCIDTQGDTQVTGTDQQQRHLGAVVGGAGGHGQDVVELVDLVVFAGVVDL